MRFIHSIVEMSIKSESLILFKKDLNIFHRTNNKRNDNLFEQINISTNFIPHSFKYINCLFKDHKSQQILNLKKI